MNFNSKETYLAYRSQWKASYEEVSHRIRLQKIAMRTASAEYSAPLKFQPGTTAIQKSTVIIKLCRTFSDASDALNQSRQSARDLLAELVLAKAEAHKQFLASRL